MSQTLRRVYILGIYRYVSKTGRTVKGLIRREVRDADTDELLKSGKYTAALWKYCDRQGWERLNKDAM